MDKKSSRKHNVITIGKLSPPLAANLADFAITTPLATSAIWQIFNTKAALDQLPDELFAHSIDWTWLFINASDIYTPAVSSAVALLGKLAPLYIHCYNDGPAQNNNTSFGLPDSWRQPNLKAIFCEYDDMAFHAKMIFDKLTNPVCSKNTVIPSRAAISSEDEVYVAACEIVRVAGRRSISLVQRTLNISYSHAACLVQAMG